MQKKKSNCDLVSIIIPAYNTSKYIKNTLESVINQTYKNLEIIVIDDASIDNAVSVVESFKDDRIKLLRNEKNLGVSETRNRGIEYANGKYLCFLDSDDMWDKKKIEKQIEFMNKNKYAIICSDYYFCDELGNEGSYVKVPEKIDYELALRNTTIFISTVMIDLEVIPKKEIYMEHFDIAQDTLLWWKLLKKYNYIYGFNGIPSKYIRRKGSLSSNKLRAVYGSFKAYLTQELGVKTIKYFGFYIINAIKRRV